MEAAAQDRDGWDKWSVTNVLLGVTRRKSIKSILRNIAAFSNIQRVSAATESFLLLPTAAAAAAADDDDDAEDEDETDALSIWLAWRAERCVA